MKKTFLFLLAFVLLLSAGTCAVADDASAFSGGTGTEADPYLISSAEDLWNLAKLVNSKEEGGYRTDGKYNGACYRLTADIDLGGRKEWKPIGYEEPHGVHYRFGGIFDGDGHTISGMYIKYKESPLREHQSAFGLFGCVSDGTVKNLTVSESSIFVEAEGSTEIGAVAGNVRNGVIENCHTTDSVSLTGPYKVGGICGSISTDSPVQDCTNAASVTATSRVGMAAGIVSHGGCEIIRCSNSGSISSTGDAAGICGNANKGISDCSNSGRITADKCASGIIDSFGDGALNSNMNDATITLARCVNTGDVTSVGSEYKGGIQSSPAGGIAGHCTTGSVVDCVNRGNVTAGADTGGIMAYFTESPFGTPCELFTVSGCSNYGSVTSTDNGHSTGGICGLVRGSETKICFENCSNSGAVSGAGIVNVLVGYNSAGGILGDGLYISELNFTDCANSGSVQGFDYAGGIAGRLDSSRDMDALVQAVRCVNSGSIYVYNSGGLTQEIYAGGIFGRCDTRGSEVDPGVIAFETVECSNTGVLDGDSEAGILCTDDMCASNKSRFE